MSPRCLREQLTDGVAGFGGVHPGLPLGQVRFVWPSRQTCKVSRRQWDVGLAFRQVWAGDRNLKAQDLGTISTGMSQWR